MQPIFAALPEQEIIKKVFKMREEVVDRFWGKKGDRFRVLPHSTLAYAREFEDERILKDIVSGFESEFSRLKRFGIAVVGTETWDRKVSLMLDNGPFRKTILFADKLFRKYRICDNNTVFSQVNGAERSRGRKGYELIEQAIGEHMKIVRDVYEDRLDKVKEFLLFQLPDRVVFDRLVLIRHGCEEKDILWEKRLEK